ncbi:hypothetical protein LJB98_01320 [Bacteroidales bacterium OttesenSCG-928-M11]|nr:hypothetical protein [Bacteroidales bacterium OttesenSCG-928-M11]
MKKSLPITAVALLLLLFSSCEKKNPLLDGVEVVLQKYIDLELIESDTVQIDNMQFFFPANNHEEGTYYIISDNVLAPAELSNGISIYLDENGVRGTITDNRLIIGGNSANDAYQQLRDNLLPLKIQLKELTLNYEAERKNKAEPFPSERIVFWEGQFKEIFDQQIYLWEKYFAENLWHPLGEDVFLYDFDYETVLKEEPDVIKRILSYAEDTFLSRPEIFEILLISEQ